MGRYGSGGGFSAVLAKPVLHFNGKLFKGVDVPGYSLLLTPPPPQIDLLIEAAKANWREVEPAIFGTLLERALNPAKRHALGAHYTPRAYVERLVLPTVMEPLRADWDNAQAAALALAHEAAQLEGKAAQAKLLAARAEIKKFHHRLCSIRVLDPTCGSANFLYVTLEYLKRLEGEVLNQLEAFGETQDQLGFEGETVTLQQLRGIELNERAAALAELVLWIGYLQWHIRTFGNASVAAPVIHNYGNIECRDAVLAWDSRELVFNEQGQPTMRYIGARQAQWPQADFILGNPPFIGASTMRATLGDGYVEALRAAWPDVPDSADFVMHWWVRAAARVGAGLTWRMGLITTNSLRQTFNRRVVQAALEGNLLRSVGTGRGRRIKSSVHSVFAVPDHPWVNHANGASVRIAMTVVQSGPGEGVLLASAKEQVGEYGEFDITLVGKTGLIHANLSVGVDVAEVVSLNANQNLSNRGVQLFGAGFIVTPEQVESLRPFTANVIREYRNGRDLIERPRGVLVIDTFGLSFDQIRKYCPGVYYWLLARVKPQ